MSPTAIKGYPKFRRHPPSLPKEGQKSNRTASVDQLEAANGRHLLRIPRLPKMVRRVNFILTQRILNLLVTHRCITPWQA
jgi:hypothetical protein